MKPYGSREIRAAVREILGQRERISLWLRILAIDDDPIMNSMIVQMLKSAGYKTKSADDGKRGLKVRSTPINSI